jgi:hypothetical protein
MRVDFFVFERLCLRRRRGLSARSPVGCCAATVLGLVFFDLIVKEAICVHTERRWRTGNEANGVARICVVLAGSGEKKETCDFCPHKTTNSSFRLTVQQHSDTFRDPTTHSETPQRRNTLTTLTKPCRTQRSSRCVRRLPKRNLRSVSVAQAAVQSLVWASRPAGLTTVCVCSAACLLSRLHSF